MEAERRHAYAIRLQCWWRGILALRVRGRLGLARKVTPLEDAKEEEARAAVVLQVKELGREREMESERERSGLTGCLLLPGLLVSS